MTPKEREDKLFNDYFSLIYHPTNQKEIAKQCAIIAVDEIIIALPKTVSGFGYGSATFNNPDIAYWKQVKTELEKL